MFFGGFRDVFGGFGGVFDGFRCVVGGFWACFGVLEVYLMVSEVLLLVLPMLLVLPSRSMGSCGFSLLLGVCLDGCFCDFSALLITCNCCRCLKASLSPSFSLPGLPRWCPLKPLKL